MVCPLPIRVVFDTLNEISKYNNITPDEWQKDVINGTEDLFILTSRQAGKSTAAEWSILKAILSHESYFCLIISPNQRQSTQRLRNIKKAFFKIPLAGRPAVVKDTETMFSISNGSSVMAVPGANLNKGAGIRGLSPDNLYLDEAVGLSDDIYNAVIEPMTAVSRGRKIITTTPGGAWGWCYDLFHSGRMKVIEIPADKCTRIKKEYLDEKKRTMPKSDFMREFFLVWTQRGAGIFDYDAIQRAFRPISGNRMREFL
jgi:hypothetical protein